MFARLSRIACPECGHGNFKSNHWLTTLDLLECDHCGALNNVLEERSLALQAYLCNELLATDRLVWLKS